MWQAVAVVSSPCGSVARKRTLMLPTTFSRSGRSTFPVVLLPAYSVPFTTVHARSSASASEMLPSHTMDNGGGAGGGGGDGGEPGGGEGPRRWPQSEQSLPYLQQGA